jgi:hypothetical protein
MEDSRSIEASGNLTGSLCVANSANRHSSIVGLGPCDIREKTMSVRAYYDAEIRDFLNDNDDRVLGILTAGHHHSLEGQQRWAWQEQLKVLKQSLHNIQDGRLFLEFYIPRMGKRADALLITGGIVFLVEFKMGASEHSQSALDQVEDYALDLKNFHEGTHSLPVVPILIS